MLRDPDFGIVRAPNEADAKRLLDFVAKHREAILNGGYSSVGIGVAQNGGLVYVVEVFRG